MPPDPNELGWKDTVQCPPGIDHPHHRPLRRLPRQIPLPLPHPRARSQRHDASLRSHRLTFVTDTAPVLFLRSGWRSVSTRRSRHAKERLPSPLGPHPQRCIPRQQTPWPAPRSSIPNPSPRNFRPAMRSSSATPASAPAGSPWAQARSATAEPPTRPASAPRPSPGCFSMATTRTVSASSTPPTPTAAIPTSPQRSSNSPATKSPSSPRPTPAIPQEFAPTSTATAKN